MTTEASSPLLPGPNTRKASSKKFQVAPCPLPHGPVEGAGNEHFSNKLLLATMLGPPTLIAFFLQLPWLAAGGLFVVTVPLLFIAYHFGYALVAQPIRPQRGLPSLGWKRYVVISDPVLAASYAKMSKIHIETFFESYFAGKMHLKGDMLETLEYRHDWASFTWTLAQAKFFALQWVPETLWHSRKQDEEQVKDHYDRGNDFYRFFLGPTMLYTSGIMGTTKERESLEVLQERKLAVAAAKINLKSGDKLLDIGSGWGSWVIHAAKQGAEATGVTISIRQVEWALEAAQKTGVATKTKYLCMDYRDIPKPNVLYDKITCFEMAEHVGILRFSTFLQQVRGMLKDDGIFFLQIAGLRRTWQYEDFMWGLFMAKYVFPGADASMPLNWFIEQLERAGFEVQSSETLGVHYSTTIYRWYENWLGNRESIVASYGERWFRIWEFFLAYSTIIARQGSATVYQLVCHKNLNSFDRTQWVGKGLVTGSGAP